MDAELINLLVVDHEITLRALEETDVDQMFGLVDSNRQHLRDFMHWMTPDYSIESAREFIQNAKDAILARKALSFGIFRKDKLIGAVGFVQFDWNSRKSEIGYWIDKAEEGQGIITRSTALLIEYAFEELKLNRIEIRCAAENIKSAAIPERLGFLREGRLRQSEYRNGRLHDFDVYGLLADDERVW